MARVECNVYLRRRGVDAIVSPAGNTKVLAAGALEVEEKIADIEAKLCNQEPLPLYSDVSFSLTDQGPTGPVTRQKESRANPCVRLRWCCPQHRQLGLDDMYPKR